MENDHNIKVTYLGGPTAIIEISGMHIGNPGTFENIKSGHCGDFGGVKN